LRVQSQTAVESPTQSHLKCIVVVVPAAPLVIDLGEGIQHRWILSGAIFGNDRELTNDDGCVCRIDVRSDCDNLISNASQEEVSSLAADIGERQDHLVRQLLLE